MHRFLFQSIRILNDFFPIRHKTDNLDKVRFCRFSTNRDYISKTGIAKPNLFKKHMNAVSIFDITDISAIEKIKEIGLKWITKQSDRKIYGHATIEGKEILAEKLELKYNNWPPKHCDILKWPNEPEVDLQVRQNLAAKAKALRYTEDN